MHIEIPSLKRSMKLLGALLITLSAITPASSIFIIAPGVVQQAGTGAFLSFVAGAVVSLLTAFVYAELSSAYPLAGGEYTIVGRILGPLPGFIVLGLNIISLILITAVIALGLGNYIGFLFPGVSPVTIGIAGVIVTTLFGILNIRTNAMITGLFLIIETAVLIVLSWLGFAHVERPFTDLLMHPLHLSTAGALEPTPVGLIGLATTVAIFAYNGYGNAVYLGEEIHDAPKRIGPAILWSLAIGVVAETVPITAVLMGAPDLQSLLGSSTMLGDFIKIVGGEKLNTVISLGIALAIINANIAFIVMVARQLFSTGRDHVWTPAINNAFMRIHKRYHSPWIATLVCGALAAAACFIDLNLLLVITGTSIVVIYGALCVAAIVGRRNGTTSHGHYRMPGYPLVPVIALLMLVYVVYASYLDPEIGRPSLWATLAMILISAGYYLLVLRRRSGGWVLKGPAD
jgi:amino acid transporter